MKSYSHLETVYSTSFFPTTTTSGLSPFHVKDHPFRPVPLNINEPPADEAELLNIRVVGVGTIGAKVAQLLARNLSGVRCHGIVKDISGDTSGDLALLLSSVRSSHLVFIVTGFDDEDCEAAAQVVGSAAVGAGVLTLVVTGAEDAPRRSCEGLRWYDAMFNVSDHSLPDHDGSVPLNPASLTQYAVRHIEATITSLITHRTGICIDFADIVSIMRGGTIGRMGVGIGSSGARGANAAMNAIGQLAAQGVEVSTATGILAVVHGSGDLSMKEFDEASKVIHDHASADANLLVGVISDEQLGGNVKVTVLAVHPN